MRLLLVVEGQTEREFVNNLIKPHLALCGVFTSATVVGKITAQRRGHRHRGGGRFKTWRRDFLRILRHDATPTLRVSTLFDLYYLPDDFPQYEACTLDRDATSRCKALEAALAKEFNDRRLIPYIQKYEFEALVLASLNSLGDQFDALDAIGLDELRKSIGSTPPEEVNGQDSPSQRLERHIPAYNKMTYGLNAIESAGIETVRAACPRFNSCSSASRNWASLRPESARATTD